MKLHLILLLDYDRALVVAGESLMFETSLISIADFDRAYDLIVAGETFWKSTPGIVRRDETL